MNAESRALLMPHRTTETRRSIYKCTQSENKSLCKFESVCAKRMLGCALLCVVGECENYIKRHPKNMHDRIYRPPKQTFTHLNE